MGKLRKKEKKCEKKCIFVEMKNINMTNKAMPFMKWEGGKTQLIIEIQG